MTSPGPPAWAQQAGEPSRWYACFWQYYCLAGPARTLESAWRRSRSTATSSSIEQRAKPTRPSAHFYGLVSAWRWSERAAAYDRADREKQALARRVAIEEANTRHAILARAAFNKTAMAINALKPEALTPDQVIRLGDFAIRMERLALGQPLVTERHEHIGVPCSGPADGVVHQNYDPTPEDIARVLEILHEHGAVEEQAPAPIPLTGDDPDV